MPSSAQASSNVDNNADIQPVLCGLADVFVKFSDVFCANEQGQRTRAQFVQNKFVCSSETKNLCRLRLS